MASKTTRDLGDKLVRVSRVKEKEKNKNDTDCTAGVSKDKILTNTVENNYDEFLRKKKNSENPLFVRDPSHEKRDSATCKRKYKDRKQRPEKVVIKNKTAQKMYQKPKVDSGRSSTIPFITRKTSTKQKSCKTPFSPSTTDRCSSLPVPVNKAPKQKNTETKQNDRSMGGENPLLISAKTSENARSGYYSAAVKRKPCSALLEKKTNNQKPDRKMQKGEKVKLVNKNRNILKEYYHILNLQQLRNLCKQKPDIIVQSLVTTPWFEDLHTCIKKERVITPDIFELLLELIVKGSESIKKDDLNKIYSELPDSLFLLKHVPYHLTTMSYSWTQKSVSILWNAIKLLNMLLNKIPGCYESLPMNVLKRAWEKYQLSAPEKNAKFSNEFSNLVEIHADLAKPKRQKNYTISYGSVKFPKLPDQGPPPGDFRTIPILPRHEDIFRDGNPYLRENLVKGPYVDSEHYLDVHFRLLCEDFQAPLREGINMLVSRIESRKKEPQKMASKGIGRIDDVNVYEGVRILNPVCKWDGLLFGLTFDVSRMKNSTAFFWKTSKKLTYGSLLCLSKDNFQTFFFATVANRDENNLAKGKIEIKIMLNPHEKVTVETNDVFLMAESRAYFEAFRHVLIGLQLTEDIPFQKYLVNCECDHLEPPAYLRSKNVEYDFSCIAEEMSVGSAGHVAPALDPKQWPPASYLGLNDSQIKALETALTKELALIQGPPGTGKTYVGLKIAKMLLSNRKKIDLGPILVVCYTNHALDQFLEGIHKFQPKGIVRIGSRSSSEIMDGCSLKNFISKLKRKYKYLLVDVKQNLDDAKDELQQIVGNIREMDKKLLPESLVRDVVRKDVVESLICDRDGYMPTYNEALLRWLNLFSDDASLNESEPTVLIPCINGQQVSTAEPLPVEGVQLSETDFSVIGTIKTAIGGGIISRSLKGAKMSQILFIDNDGLLKYQVIKDKKCQFSVNGTTAIHDDKWHEVVITYEEQGKKICLYVDENLEAEKNDCALHKYKHEKERVLVGSDPFPKELQKNDMLIKELVYIPNVISISNENFVAEIQEPDIEELQVVYETDVIQQERVIDGDHDIEGFHPQKSKPTILEKILARQKDDRRSWTVVKNSENELSKLQNMLKNELQKKCSMRHERAEKVKDVWALKPEERWQLYRRWVVAARQEYYWRMTTKQVEYDDAIEAYKDVESREEAKLLKSHASVIGMTTTGAAKRSKLLKEIGARAVIVEEAAEVLESHIVTSLTRECEHLILIGDHKQLRPTPNVYDLELHFNFHVSLFERMINNGLHHECLKKQHRMRPEISQVSRHIYPDLEDHETVFRFANISGVKHNIYFVHHDEIEATEGDTKSHVNKHEARFIVALCKFFLQQGYKRSQITILTPYTGQLSEIQKCAKNVLPRPPLNERNVRVTSIDNYQGEENDIILLSLVRSNNRGNIGFLKTENRVCVALSRAKMGLYCVGNMEMMCKDKKNILWRKIITGMESRGLLGRKLTLCCQMHDDRRIDVETAEDFQHAPNGGCSRICNKELSCGHTCKTKCHPVDQEHVDQYRCLEACEKIPCDSHLNRKCKNPCSKKCSLCDEIVMVVLPNCNHNEKLPCHIAEGDLSKIKCTNECPEMLSCGHQCPNPCSANCGPCGILVKRPLPDCGHEVEMQCFADPEEFDCPSQCFKILPCGHPCADKCSHPCGKCNIKVLKTLPGCGHQVELACYKSPSKVKCVFPCSKLLECGHPCTELCGKECSKVCKSMCSNKLGCGHACSKSCSERCDPCQVVIQVVLPKCHHITKIPCSQDPKKATCPNPCQLTFGCGHPCAGKCSEVCPPCVKIVRKIIPGCRHECDACCSAPLGSISCQHPCDKILTECGHRCQKKCSEPCFPCIQLIRKRCPQNDHPLSAAPCSKPASEVFCPFPCEKALDCGHNCGKTCSDPCYPCQVVVFKEIPLCKHKQEMFCSTRPEDTRCQFPCQKRLVCGHPCPKRCSEECGPCVSTELVVKTLPSCGHENKVPCNQNPSEFLCQQPHLIQLSCGHKKSVSCQCTKLSCKPWCQGRGNTNCGPACSKCFFKQLKALPCGHKKHVVCFKFGDETACLSCSSLFMRS